MAFEDQVSYSHQSNASLEEVNEPKRGSSAGANSQLKCDMRWHKFANVRAIGVFENHARKRSREVKDASPSGNERQIAQRKDQNNNTQQSWR